MFFFFINTTSNSLKHYWKSALALLLLLIIGNQQFLISKAPNMSNLPKPSDLTFKLFYRTDPDGAQSLSHIASDAAGFLSWNATRVTHE